MKNFILEKDSLTIRCLKIIVNKMFPYLSNKGSLRSCLVCVPEDKLRVYNAHD